VRYSLAHVDLPPEAEENVLRCLRSGILSHRSHFLADFERAFARHLRIDHAVACSHGSAALHLALAASGVGRGDEVIVPDLAYIAVRNSVLDCNAIPVPVDVDLGTWNIDPQEIERAITAQTKAIIVVHTLGVPCAMDDIQEIAAEHDLVVIEDACEALGGSCYDEPLGTIGDVGVFSFYGNKPMTAGEGGMLVTANAEIAGRARHLLNQAQGSGRPYFHTEPAWNYRMTGIQAAILLPQVPHITRDARIRQHLHAVYRRKLEGADVLLQGGGERGGCWTFGILLKPRAKASLHLHDVETRPLFYPISRQDGNRPVLDNAFRIARSRTMLPSHASMSASDVGTICRIIREAL
jgi:perosamine synthetase